MAQFLICKYITLCASQIIYFKCKCFKHHPWLATCCDMEAILYKSLAQSLKLQAIGTVSTVTCHYSLYSYMPLLSLQLHAIANVFTVTCHWHSLDNYMQL